MKPTTFKTMAEAVAFMVKEGGVGNLNIIHDDTCTFGDLLPCNCHPDYVVEDLTVENLMASAKAAEMFRNRHKNN
jgi:hypothetical protein